MINIGVLITSYPLSQGVENVFNFSFSIIDEKISFSFNVFENVKTVLLYRLYITFLSNSLTILTIQYSFKFKN